VHGRRIAAVLALLVFAPAVPGEGSTSGQPEPLLPSPSWYRPVIVDGFTFPVARANWLSVVEFRDDWHDPRFRLVSGRWVLVGFHEGNDILAEEGTPILAATSGTVEAVGWTFYSGLRVGVRGQDSKYYFYAHLSEVAPGISVGAAVQAGEVLGLVGNSGYGPPGTEDEFFPHLHFGIQGPGGWENPFPLVRRLYRRSVKATGDVEDRLLSAGQAGRADAFERLSRSLYATLWDGEG
jgi:murein DD-endopeptidase MepM/ murein hydrolase activator NlpD